MNDLESKSWEKPTMQQDWLIDHFNIWDPFYKQWHSGLEVVFWTHVQRSGVQISSFPRFFYFSYELWGSWVQILIEFALFFPTWNYYSFVIYHFYISWIMHICLQKSLSNYLTFRSFFDQCVIFATLNLDKRVIWMHMLQQFMKERNHLNVTFVIPTLD